MSTRSPGTPSATRPWCAKVSPRWVFPIPVAPYTTVSVPGKSPPPSIVSKRGKPVETRAADVTKSKDTDGSGARQRERRDSRGIASLSEDERQRENPQRERAGSGRGRAHVAERERARRTCHLLSHAG